MNEEQIYLKLSAMCARAEHCAYDMDVKMRRWQVPEEVRAEVIARLVKERFIDDERYTRAFVEDKIKYNKWGRRKIEQALFMKHIDGKIVDGVLDNVPDKTFLDILRPLLAAKRRSTKAESDFELRGKLIRFALSRGFTMNLIEVVI